MGKKFVQIAAFLLALCLLPVLPARAAGEEEIIRVGLCYSSSAMEGSNLLNSTGSGYRFGYYDQDNQFVELASTGEQAISVVKTTNVGYTASPTTAYHNYLESLAGTADVVVGCYHLQLPGSYSSYADAASAAAMYAGGFVAYVEGVYYARAGNYQTRAAAEAAAAGTQAQIVGTSSYGVSVVITGTNTILFQYDDAGSGTGLGVMPGQTDTGEQLATWFKGNQWSGGFRFERIGGGNLTVVNMISLEDYVRGILPYEMSNSWPLEALKAQAVCARSYTMTNLNRHAGNHFDICNTTHCQVYYGTGSANENTDRAVDETAGEYAWYNGEIAQTYYHSCDGGATENVENVWTESLPYLRGVMDPYEALVEEKISGYRWTTTYTGEELQDRMVSSGYTSCGVVVDAQVTKTTPTGNVYSVTVTDINGKKFTVSKDSVRTVFGVSSLRYTISGGGSTTGDSYAVTGGTLDSLDGAWVIGADGEKTQLSGSQTYAATGEGTQTVTASGSSGGGDGTFVFSGTGKGHNLGMSQWGAYAMAQEGYTYKDILTFYFTGVEIHQ